MTDSMDFSKLEEKLSPGFALKCLGRLLARQPRDCPHCGSSRTRLLGRKRWLMELRLCDACYLMFRHPKDGVEESSRYYQEAYEDSQSDYASSSLRSPGCASLAHSIVHGFAAAAYVNNKIRIVRRVRESGFLLDYGCSWGKILQGFRWAGYDAMGYEVSRPRAAFGRKQLHLDILQSPQELDRLEEATFDIVFSSHVLEHLPDLPAAFRQIRRLLRPDGVLVAFVPNAGCPQARELGARWPPMIGQAHCNALDARFFAHNLPAYGLYPLFSSEPHVGEPIPYPGADSELLDGWELMVVARPA